MGRPSKFSRSNHIARLRKRPNLKECYYAKKIKQKEEEISDLQVDIQNFQKFIKEAGGKVYEELNKSQREQNNLLKWIDVYTEQIKNLEKELHLLQLKFYTSSSNTQPSQPQQITSLSQPLQPQQIYSPSQPSQPCFQTHI
ncbi:8113_t:CDS:2 [Funneliformis geosporum]|uniref:8113_t:CDS:1 n=1 Tax=Funneliformis geosporum TaxID=1117311 RepID=A0A9W4X4W4_9GLOM|nr:8113_t:CDS:2 [Funneliformis geosporum]